ncbi:MAG TPA: hypothetical protein VMH35_09675 [Streptosporangiaceae bacterium]|nr:hypothetical protein [Streptosporangiaceae bacterium]
MASSTGQAASPPQPGEGAPGDAQAAAAPARRSRNWLATAALACGVLGGAVLTIPAGFILGVLGLRRAGQTGRGRVRCWLAIALTPAWAGAAGYLLPRLIRAADPGCAAYKDTALTSDNRVVADVSNGAGPQVLARDLAAAVRQTGRAARDSRNPATARSLAALSSGLRTMLADLRSGTGVPRHVLLTLNQDTGTADGACGTV